MTKIIRSKDCGNSPKNQLVEDLTVALLTHDLQTAAALTTEDVQWHLANGKSIHGREAVLKEAENVRSIQKLTVLHALTHGKSGAVNGNAAYARCPQTP